jgi:aminoglycoside phosphotransferase (APT) family kinase protein
VAGAIAVASTTALTSAAMSAPDVVRPQTSTRDPEVLRAHLERWLATRLPADAAPRVTNLQVPQSNGMSSETLLFDASWRVDGQDRHEALVARVAPDPAAVPVFQTYDLERQARIMQIVRQQTTVPVPLVHWVENDPAAIGAPFFIMQRIDGIVPPDIMPYPFGDSWLFHAAPADQARLQEATVRVLAELHAIPNPRATFPFLDAPGDPRTPLRRHVDGQRAFYAWAMEGIQVPVLERGFEWIDAHWPAEDAPPVLSWGDSRIGNVLYADFAPVAVLDWEMAALGPRELDLGWLIYIHRFFDDMAVNFGMGGMPDFLRRDDVAASYARLSGYTPRDLDFYIFYSAFRHGIVMARISRRQMRFGELEMPADPSDLVMHRATLDRMMEGSYWSRL